MRGLWLQRKRSLWDVPGARGGGVSVRSVGLQNQRLRAAGQRSIVRTVGLLPSRWPARPPDAWARQLAELC